ncbi:Syntenin-2 [Myotis davidii]|uniref:Syntenin-2 n=1 Tax=Myotis davidii TaxID=225400 RepID=L5MB36_MYODS|nr:Syntenin-2 [Myotis davidii]
MSTLYPSLEDLKVDQAIQAQARDTPKMPILPVQETPVPQPSGAPSLCGLGVSSPGKWGASVPAGRAVVSAPYTPPEHQEETTPRRDLGSAGAGLFVQLVQVNTPASLVGLRFGDQILQIDGRDCAGWSTDRAHRAVKRAPAEKIVMVVRDRPFQRTVTMHRDSTGHVGFVIKKGKVVSVVKGSSAARNGLLTNHYVCEVNGQNVIGLKDKQVMEILATAGSVITLTIIPTVIYEHMVKKTAEASGFGDLLPGARMS